MTSCLAIITARGGSKRIPRKNIRLFLGQPIIKYSIDAAMLAGCFTEIMVSTDDKEIGDLATSFGASVPFFRSPGNANDFATTADVIVEVLKCYKEVGIEFDYCCCIYPTAPFVTPAKLDKAFKLIREKKAKSVVPVVKYGSPILRSFQIEKGFLKMNWPEYMNSRSQDLPSSYHDCGQFYFLQVASFLEDLKLFTDETVAVEMPESEVQDIDNEEDWEIAEAKFKILSKSNKL